MGTNIPERRDGALFIPTDHQRHAEERLGFHRAWPDVRREQRGIPKAGQWRAGVLFRARFSLVHHRSRDDSHKSVKTDSVPIVPRWVKERSRDLRACLVYKAQTASLQ